MEEVPAEQTRVYQNQPDSQSPPVQSVPRSPPRLRPGVKKKTSQSGSGPDAAGQNVIEEDRPSSMRPVLPNMGLDGNGAIWVSGITEQPGFLFPVAPPTTPPPLRRQITEEASLSVTPNLVGPPRPPVPHRPLTSVIKSLLRCLLCRQGNDYSLPEEDLPSLQPDVSPPEEDVQVTDVFYEDTFQDSGLGGTGFAATPGQTGVEDSRPSLTSAGKMLPSTSSCSMSSSFCVLKRTTSPRRPRKTATPP